MTEKLNLKDIRIGNYLNHNDQWNYAGYKGIFQWNENDYYATSECLLFVENIEPIRLTSEILLACGFEYFEYNNSYQLDSDLGFSFWGRINDGFNCYCQGEEFGNTFKTLHQLQNLYYFLCNQELEFKPELK